jgi:hypothetical protein
LPSASEKSLGLQPRREEKISLFRSVIIAMVVIIVMPGWVAVDGTEVGHQRGGTAISGAISHITVW